MASNEPKSTPEYGKLKNFWEASMYTNILLKYRIDSLSEIFNLIQLETFASVFVFLILVRIFLVNEARD